ncbi:MAG: type II toxin-antitoxin system VapC family toxin [Pseudonocardia sp.]|nr:type II toxin-antitoxin system VapC family toxin [Pseudonocardia sp.]
MRLLIDSHVLLWWLDGADRLGATARAAIGDGDNEAVVSAATLWELSIKQAAGKLDVDVDLREHSAEQGFRELPVSGRHAVAVRGLPRHHRDPFGRMLIAQAGLEGLTLVTADRALAVYDVPILPAS